MLTGIEIRLGDARFDLILAAMRLDRAESMDWPIVDQLRAIHAWRAERVKMFEEKQRWWEDK